MEYLPPIANKYGKGAWKTEIKKKFSTDYILVSFLTEDGKHFDEKHTLDFNNTKARLITKSPRNKTSTEFKEKLQFYRSSIFWIEGIELFKI